MAYAITGRTNSNKGSSMMAIRIERLSNTAHSIVVTKFLKTARTLA
ncbi:MAG: type III secretion system effector GTPase activator YopE family protein [gamma proteobacterium symbiont of Clathrolucina costata]